MSLLQNSYSHLTGIELGSCMAMSHRVSLHPAVKSQWQSRKNTQAYKSGWCWVSNLCFIPFPDPITCCCHCRGEKEKLQQKLDKSANLWITTLTQQRFMWISSCLCHYVAMMLQNDKMLLLTPTMYLPIKLLGNLFSDDFKNRKENRLVKIIETQDTQFTFFFKLWLKEGEGACRQWTCITGVPN